MPLWLVISSCPAGVTPRPRSLVAPGAVQASSSPTETLPPPRMNRPDDVVRLAFTTSHEMWALFEGDVRIGLWTVSTFRVSLLLVARGAPARKTPEVLPLRLRDVGLVLADGPHILVGCRSVRDPARTPEPVSVLSQTDARILDVECGRGV